MSRSEELKQIAQLRQAIVPLADILKKEIRLSLEKELEEKTQLTKRVVNIETALVKLADKKVKFDIDVKAPDVNVEFETPAELTNAVSKLSKKQDLIPITPDYKPHDQAKKGTFQYSGFVAQDGSWYIQRVAKGEQRYAKGKDNYPEAWDSRDTQKYGLFGG